MAPITDDVVNELKSTITKLESRIHELEAQLSGSSGSSASSSGSMRMVLMGPPGAGKFLPRFLWAPYSDYNAAGKGTQAPRIKDKYCVCHLVSAVDTMVLWKALADYADRLPATCSVLRSRKRLI